MIQIDNLTKKYDSFELNVSMEIPSGMITGLVGKNGAGKSTTIKAILGLIKPDGGTVKVFGKNSRELTPADKQGIGVTLSESNFSGYLTPNDINAILKRMYKEYDEKMFVDGCKNEGIPMKKTIKDFSTGMKAKIKVLVALSHNAKLLVMDEPTAGLDVEARNNILDMMREYLANNEDRAILITSHISSDLESLCDDIYLIHDGKVVIHEDTDAILDQYGILKVDEVTYEKLDKEHIIKARKESFGYACFTDQKQFYIENYPGIVVDNGSIDELILMMTGGR